jgi:hypothetical protein
MSPSATGPEFVGSLFDTAAPIEHWLRDWKVRGLAPAVGLRPLDAYLLRQLACLDESVSAIVDLAAPATWGATTLLLARHAQGRKVIVPALPEMGETGWPAALKDRLAELEAAAAVSFAQGAGVDAVRPSLEGGRRVLVTLAADAPAPQQVLAALHAIGDACRHAVFVLLPLGPLGDDPLLEAILAWARGDGWRLHALRDLGPFLGASTLGVVHALEAEDVPEVLERIRLLFAGNFDFLSLAEQAVTAAQEAGALRAQLQRTQEELAAVRQQLQAGSLAPAPVPAPSGKMAQLLRSWRGQLGRIKRFLLRRPG